MTKNFRDKPLKVFASYIATHKKMFAIDMICALLVAVIDLVFPYISRVCMYSLLPEKMYAAFFAVMIVMILAYVMKAGLYYVITVVGHYMGVLVESDMRCDVFEHMQKLSFSYYDQNRTGVLMSHITTDLFEITELSHHGPENIVISLLTLIGAVLVMFTMQWKLALAITMTLPICIWFTLSQRERFRRTTGNVKAKTAEINAVIESSISGVRTAKAFANEEAERVKFHQANEVFKTCKDEYYKAMGLYQSGMEFTTGVMQVIVILVGGMLIMSGNMDYVELVTFTLYVSTFVSPVRRLSMFAEQYTSGMAGFNRFIEVMLTEPEITDIPNAKILNHVKGDIEFENVFFSYENEIPVLENINLHIRPGKTLAVIGPSGGGKTTLCQLLPRFYDVREGSVRVDGLDVREVTQESLRKNIGILQQDVFMFAGTIRDNIRYGKPDATEEEIIEAAKKAEIHEEICGMKDGYDSYIGERGVMLSGGQKQRISIARIFLKNPKILILDEATSALDTITERRIQKSLDNLSVGRTTIIIAHRLSTIQNADEIAVIEGERIVEYGSHRTLMEMNGVYAQLCEAQSLAKEVTVC